MMAFEPWTAALLALTGALLTLDRVAFLQSLASRPLPTAVLAGFIVGEPKLGLMVGVALELVWLSRQPVGGSVPPDETLATLAAVAAAHAAPPEWSGYARSAAGALIGLPYGLVGRRLDLLARKANAGLVEKTRQGLVSGDMEAPGRAQLKGAFNFFLAGLAGSAFAAVSAGPLAALMLSGSPERLERVFAAMAVVMPVVGAGAIIGSMNGKKPLVFFAGGAGAALFAVKAGLAGMAAGFRGRGRAL